MRALFFPNKETKNSIITLNKMVKKLINWIFAAEVILFGLIITGILPRETALYLAAGLAAYVLLAPVEDAVVLFIRSIPLFLALPFTADFDNFNTWRILAALIFIKWFAAKFLISKSEFLNNFKIPNPKFKISNFRIPLILLLAFATLSIVPAADKILAVKRIIYFLNLSLIGVVIFDLARKSDTAKRFIKNISVPVIIVTLVGMVQLVSTYFIDIYQFMRIWGEGIQCRQFGSQWCSIAVELGNTWFAYYGEQLSLRVFSLFPDSHSFPQFVLLGLPAIFALALSKFGINDFENLKKMYRTRTRLIIILVPMVFLVAILSGTRGIWAASVGVLLFMFIIFKKFQRTVVAKEHKNLFKYLATYMVIFFMLFSVAYPIFVSPQFLLSKGSFGLFGSRIRSIIDFGETSNNQRIAIWKETVESIKDKPFLGVGIGNFPVVLGQDLFLAKAGSSAHNLYLQIAAEMGVAALAAAIWFLVVLLNKTFHNFVREKDQVIAVYNGASLLTIPWVLMYSFTDVALFDERAFLIFIAVSAIILGTKNSSKDESSH
ncbi:MAG: O-antigen ligase family protein [Candidatus Yanofskybacteria bacterium]|nr:O-antigen ligase family protein [Candidatus Yanofskybacteria bacterium]